MTADAVRVLLESLQRGETSLESAAAALSARPAVADLAYAQVDLDRRSRCGFPEVILGEGKTAEWIEGVARELHAAGQDVLATRIAPAQVDPLSRAFPAAEIDPLGRTFWYPVAPPMPPRGLVFVVTAGTGDIPVAREAANTAKYLGCRTETVVDAGVAGLHRLLRHLDRIREADVVIAIAGMDGVMPGALGGLIDCPVIAVPTSIGYGTAFGGVAPLLTMLNSCSANVLCVNIDAGFRAGYAAALMVRRIHPEPERSESRSSG